MPHFMAIACSHSALLVLRKVWVMFYFGVGAGTGGHADILIAFSKDLIHWDKDEDPLYRAGGHPDGIDAEHAHKISIIYDDKGIGYLYALMNFACRCSR